MHIVITGSIFNLGNCEPGTKVCLEPQADGVFREGKIIASCYSGCLCDFLMLPDETSALVPLLFLSQTRLCWNCIKSRLLGFFFSIFFFPSVTILWKMIKICQFFFAITRCLVFRTKTKLGQKSQRRTVSVGLTWKKKKHSFFFIQKLSASALFLPSF